MVELNWYIVFITALIPMVVGMVWYNKNVFGTAWMQATGMTVEKAKGANMPLIFGLTYVFGLMISVAMIPMTIHQFHIMSVFEGNEALKDPNSSISLYIKEFLTNYGSNFRTFKHGAFHGLLGVKASLF